MNSSEKVILCRKDSTATCKLSDITLDYAIFDKRCATTIAELYSGKTSIPFTMITPIYYQIVSKIDITSKVDVDNLSFCSLQDLLLCFLINVINFEKK